jgi:peptidoglycan hydrolase-like protein with peptidoglycan-binding domain
MKLFPASCLSSAMQIVLVMLVILPSGSQLAHAALRPADPLDSISSQLMPRSPLVERLQVLFAELKIYDGVIDGRLNDDLTAAIQNYQARSGVAVDGKVSEELLAHVEFKSEAEALLVRLDTVGSEQRSKAREKLQSAALTRSLLNTKRKNQIADPTRNRDICFQAPTADCLIAEAIESAKAVGRPNFRDWTYGEIAIVQARLGQVEAARETAGRIQDPRLILVTLRNIATSLADENKVELAQDSAAIIPDDWLKAEALVAVAVAQTRNGGWPDARQTMREIQMLTDGARPEDKVDFKRTVLTTSLAQKLVEAGDPVVALQLMHSERDRLAKISDKSTASASLSTLAAAFAQIDKPEEAKSLLDYSVDLVHRRSVSVALARAYGRAGQNQLATAIVNALEEPRYRSILLADLALWQAGQGHKGEARKNLLRAETAVDAIKADHRYAINHARNRIATSWVAVGDFDKARAAAVRISDAGIRTGAWSNISLAALDAGVMDVAGEAAEKTKASLRAVSSSLDRVWLYCRQVQVLANRKNNQQALFAFSQALKTAKKIRHSWTRAQALVRLVRAFSVLAGPQGSLRAVAK